MNLTNEQKREMAIIIDTWYIKWKDNIVDSDVPHKFGFAKEELKRRMEE